MLRRLSASLVRASAAPVGPARWFWVFYVVTLAGYALGVAIDHPLISFTPDSWTLLELARSFGTDDPYAVTVLRSYWSGDHSAAFPPGYPYLLHLLGLPFGASPYVGVALNLVAVALTPFASARLARALGGEAIAGHLAAFALLLYMPYYYEVICARTLPLTILLTLVGLASLLTARSGRDAALAGAVLGASCLLRFDQLPLVALLFAFSAWRLRAPRLIAVAGAAALATLTPWIAYSLQTFGVVWATDNSWLALSARPAFVTDFPAVATTTLWTDPGAFFALRAQYAQQLLWAVEQALPWFPAIVVALLAWPLLGARDQLRSRGVWALAVVAWLALAPQLLVGYSDLRYLAFPLFATMLVLALQIPSDFERGSRLARHQLLGLVLGIAAVASWLNAQHQDVPRLLRAELQTHMVALLGTCNAAEPEVRYVFANPALGSRYGVEQGRPAALMPRNLQRGNQNDPAQRARRERFERSLAPLRYVSDGARGIVDRSAFPTRCEDALSARVEPVAGTIP